MADVRPAGADGRAPEPAAAASRGAWEFARARLALPAGFGCSGRLVVSIAAAAGYGKSALLAQWAAGLRAEGRRVIQLLVGHDDREGNQLLIDLHGALYGTSTQRPESILDGLGATAQAALLRSLLAELGSLPAFPVLVLDDVHALADGHGEHLLRQVVRQQPDNLLLVLSGRRALPGVVTTALMEGRLHEYGDQDLAMNADEVGRLLGQHHLEARPPLVATLLQRTQGWPAALRLVALTLQADPRAQDRFVAGLTSAPQALAAYLNDTLFKQLTADTREFLLAVCLVRSFDAGLARALSRREDAGRLLQAVVAQALPLRVSDDAEPVYTIHPLLRDFLVSRLQQAQPAVLASGLARALELLLERGEVERAIEVCLDGGDLHQAARLISAQASTMVEKYGRHSRYLHWVNMLPERTLRAYPDIRIRQAWSLNFLRRFDEAEAIRTELELAAADDPHGAHALRRALDMQRFSAAALGDRSEASITRVNAWLQRWPGSVPVEQAAARIVLAFAEKSAGYFEAAIGHCQEAQSFARTCRGPYLLAWASMLLTSVLFKLGRCRQALSECDQALQELAPELGADAPGVVMMHAMRAGLLYEFNRLPEAASALETGLTALIEQASTDPIIIGFVTLARLQVVQQDLSAALDTLREGQTQGLTRRLPRVALSLGAEEIVTLLRAGELDIARDRWGALQDAFSCGQHGPFARALEDKSGRIQARLGLAEGRYAESATCLDLPLQRARRSGQKRKEVEILCLLASARFLGGEAAGARATFTELLGTAMSAGYGRTLVDEGALLQPLLAHVVDSGERERLPQPSRDYLDQLAGDIGLSTASAVRRAAPAALAEPLTARELEIVSRLRAGLTNRQLSDALFISPGTLKWHLSNVYGKLGVSNRLAAVARCQELGLVEG